MQLVRSNPVLTVELLSPVIDARRPRQRSVETVMAETQIEWTDASWNPVAGCSIISAGCTNCYAMEMARRLQAMNVPKYKGLTAEDLLTVAPGCEPDVARRLVAKF